MLKTTATNAKGLLRLFASLNEGISWEFVGHVHSGVSVICQPNFLNLDSADREEILKAISETYPDLQVHVVKPVPPAARFIFDDDEEREESKIIIP